MGRKRFGKPFKRSQFPFESIQKQSSEKQRTQGNKQAFGPNNRPGTKLKKEEIAKHAHRDYLFFNALRSIYRMCDRTAGEEIRASLELNDRTGKQGQMKKLMAEMERLSA